MRMARMLQEWRRQAIGADRLGGEVGAGQQRGAKQLGVHPGEFGLRGQPQLDGDAVEPFAAFGAEAKKAIKRGRRQNPPRCQQVR